MKKNGFTLIELVIAIGLSAIFIPAIVYVYSFSLGSASQGESYTKAYTLAQEAMEAVYFLKENDGEWDWENYPAIDTYHISKGDDGVWVLVNGTPVDYDGDGYIVSVEIGNRDDGADILQTRTVTVKVSWEEKGQPTDIDLISYISKH